MTERQPWPAKGDQVAVYTQFVGRAHVILIAVGKVTDTQIILDDGTKFRTSDYWQIKGNSQLLRTDDPTVVDHFARKATETLGYDLDRLFREYRNNLTGSAHDRAIVVLGRAAELIDATQVAIGLASAGSTEGT